MYLKVKYTFTDFCFVIFRSFCFWWPPSQPLILGPDDNQFGATDASIVNQTNNPLIRSRVKRTRPLYEYRVTLLYVGPTTELETEPNPYFTSGKAF